MLTVMKFFNADNLYESPERSTGMYMYMLVFSRFTIAADVLNLHVSLYSGIPARRDSTFIIALGACS